MIYKAYHGSCEVTSSPTSVYSGQSVGKGKMENCRQDQAEAEEAHHPDPSLSALLSCPQSPWLTTESDSLREVARCQLPPWPAPPLKAGETLSAFRLAG